MDYFLRTTIKYQSNNYPILARCFCRVNQQAQNSLFSSVLPQLLCFEATFVYRSVYDNKLVFLIVPFCHEA